MSAPEAAAAAAPAPEEAQAPAVAPAPAAEAPVEDSPRKEAVAGKAVENEAEESAAAAPKEESPSAAPAEDVAATGPVEDSLPSFKEESNFEKDLKESEKKALKEFSDKVEAAVKANEFVLPPKVEIVKEVTEVAKVEEAVVVISTVEKEVIEGDAVVKIEGVAAVAVIAPEAVAESAEASAPEAPSEIPAEAPPAPAGASPAETPAEVSAPAEIATPPAAVEESKVPEEKPAAAEESKVPEEKPAAAEESKVPEEKPAAAEESKVPEEKPAAAEESKVPEEKPAAAEESKAPEEKSASEIPAEKIEAPPSEEVAAEVPVAVVETTEVVEEKDLEPPEDLELWGVPLLPSKNDPRTQVIFLKFLRARDFKVKEAFVMLKNCILWRKKYGIAKILEEDLGTDFESSAFNHGVDKEGHPVQYNVFGVFQDKELYQKVFADPSQTEKALRWRVQLLEKEIQQKLSFHPGGVTSMLQVVDLKNASLMKKSVRQFMGQAVTLLTDNYPELVVKMVFLNVPWYFNAIYAFLSPFLTQRMKSKYTIAGSLFKFIAPDNIPVQYGGLGRVNDEDFGDGSAPVTELVLKAGEKKTAEIDVSGAGVTVVWEVALVGSDLTYGAEFVPSKEGGYTTIVEKPKKLAVLEEPIRTSFKSPESGKLVLILDNSLSRKKKSALYRYTIKAAAE